MYRYLLERKTDSLVLVKDELEFIDSYMFLINIRHGKSIQFNNQLSKQTINSIYIPPNTLQMLAENAIKHNQFSSESPLKIQFDESDQLILVSNNYRKRKLIEATTGIGLDNIAKRYEIVSGKRIVVEKNEESFIVKLPKIHQKEYESINI